MRLKANHDGKSLNQRGLFDGVIRDKNDRTKKLHPGEFNLAHYHPSKMGSDPHPGRRIAGETEEEIFRLLGR
jgi:hypothetical protein